MKKRLLPLALALAMGLSLAACSGGAGTAATPAPQTGAPAAGSDWAYVQGNGPQNRLHRVRAHELHWRRRRIHRL